MEPLLDPRFESEKQKHAQLLETAIQQEKIDPLMIPFSRFVRETRDYFTTSTCSGRITLMDLNEDESKKEGAFYRKWHACAKASDVWNAIQEKKYTGNLWFKQDAFVYVIGTHNHENVKRIFDACQKAGIKRHGIHYEGKGKILIEIFGSQAMCVPITNGKDVLVNEAYVKEIVKIGNVKWKRNETKRKELEKELQKAMKETNQK
ncbi:MAG: hypothetical protein AABY11_00235 [archaeon]